MTNRVRQYLTDDEYPAIGHFVEPLTLIEQQQTDAFRAAAIRNHWFIIEDRSVPGVVLLSARPMWVKVPNNG